ncbi:MAG TPA: phosphohistidine phosphatase SixA [Bryobacteraceae bacterium]|nr:phosphohistidine phosphatase SixA [Bryobacteraceae bacterium]
MEIYLLRHGIAEERSSSGRDADRRLTDEGREKLHKVLACARAAGVSPSIILTSPLRRAFETAEMAAHDLGYEGKLVRTEALAPGASPKELWQEFRQHRDQSSLLAAGHDPLFSSGVAYLLGSTRHMVNFRKGALIRIDVESFGAEPAGILQWMITAGVARVIT